MKEVPFCYWECPECGDVCSDPPDFRTTECHNHHVVQLGHERSNGWLDVYLVEPSAPPSFFSEEVSPA